MVPGDSVTLRLYLKDIKPALPMSARFLLAAEVAAPYGANRPVPAEPHMGLIGFYGLKC